MNPPFGGSNPSTPVLLLLCAMVGCSSSQGTCNNGAELAALPAALIYPTGTTVWLPVDEIILTINPAYVVDGVNVRTNGVIIHGQPFRPVPSPAPSALPSPVPGFFNVASFVTGVQPETTYTVTAIVVESPSCGLPPGYYDVGTFTTL